MTLRKVLLLALIVGLIIAMFGCTSSEEKIRAEEDRVVVECAEPMLWDFSYIASPEFRSFEASHMDFLYLLASDGIFLFEDQHPFKEYDNYIAFKADYYREWFAWGNLPPEDIMRKCGVSPP